MTAQQSDDVALRLAGVAVRSERFALGPLDLEIPRGIVTAVIGPNGSGKSTLFRLLMNMEPYQEGKAELLGMTIGPDADESYKQRIGFLAELPYSYEDALTAEEKARFASLWYPGWNWDRYRKLVRGFDAEEANRTKLRKLSKGLRRKVELAGVLAPNPELLLLDEPSSGLDPFAWKTMIDELQRYMEQGDRTLIIATHIAEEVKRLADCVLFLHRGKTLGFYEKDELFDSWRSITVSLEDEGASAANLKRAPGVQDAIESAPGIWQLATDRSDEAEAFCRSEGCRVIATRRMELEDIMGCLIRKEEARR
ncbi:ATP-binding cassette domain-containing protein [Cohnella zeiphila]|uniref:ABC transporter ATP-binding protein n=1 Tax=Cohnella zeiphila TaxID=2761120 RepID=A0A7X0VTP3_9BACL|nr:ABC transporter ATP-binding protein [Cohnella zeiphila]